MSQPPSLPPIPEENPFKSPEQRVDVRTRVWNRALVILSGAILLPVSALVFGGVGCGVGIPVGALFNNFELAGLGMAIGCIVGIIIALRWCWYRWKDT